MTKTDSTNKATSKTIKTHNEATMITITCDKCKNKITNTDKMIHIHICTANPSAILNIMDGWHYCQECAKHMGKTAAEKDEKPKERKKRGIPRKESGKFVKRPGGYGIFDEGKIIALYNAGWSAEKIADDMGIAESAVEEELFRLRGGVG